MHNIDDYLFFCIINKQSNLEHCMKKNKPLDLTPSLVDGTLPYSFVLAMKDLVSNNKIQASGNIITLSQVVLQDFNDACKNCGISYPEKILDYVEFDAEVARGAYLDAEVLMSTGLKIFATIYKDSGKYYASGVVDIVDDKKIFDSHFVYSTFVKNQKLVHASTLEDRNYYFVALDDMPSNNDDPNYQFTVARLYRPLHQ